ncbi:hypothetical protein MSG28_010115 [Choristoneura fumiferana]|uniref:Uncharacterized protein n=1 Tax=Choristoneura fumiferana TaxID=7141 RepID=A0ACC0KJD9_CHOFU|nr:hypothetical protein MSG28_010115 [Choristoneura fumiferana]
MQGQQNAIISGIDPTYLAAYSNNTPYVAGHQHQQMQREMQMERQMQFLPDPPFGSDYQNRNLMLVDRNNYKTFTPQADSCAKCVSIRAGESCAKNLVIRDDNGPAMQVVYYEIDFLLAELKLPCTVRVIGRMMPGTCRLQAFNVRAATGDDVATLSRRAAVASHHVAKLCKEYGATDDKN